VSGEQIITGAFVTSQQRRLHLLNLLRETRHPIPGAELSQLLGVSRQAVVQDIAILRSAGHDILATSRGYILASALQPPRYRAEVLVQHAPEQTEQELIALVDLGVTVVDVAVTHAIYGEIRGRLQLSSRTDVADFLNKIATQQAHLLSELTDGLHLHVVEAPTAVQIARARQELARLGFLVADV
jgi:transcriptional regulator of NAD metabolism